MDDDVRASDDFDLITELEQIASGLRRLLNSSEELDIFNDVFAAESSLGTDDFGLIKATSRRDVEEENGRERREGIESVNARESRRIADEVDAKEETSAPKEPETVITNAENVNRNVERVKIVARKNVAKRVKSGRGKEKSARANQKGETGTNAEKPLRNRTNDEDASSSGGGTIFPATPDSEVPERKTPVDEGLKGGATALLNCGNDAMEKLNRLDIDVTHKGDVVAASKRDDAVANRTSLVLYTGKLRIQLTSNDNDATAPMTDDVVQTASSRLFAQFLGILLVVLTIILLVIEAWIIDSLYYQPDDSHIRKA